MSPENNTPSNASKWAALLNGRQYGSEMTNAEQEAARADDVLIIFGQSDDLMEMRGILYDEADCYNGRTFFLADGGVLDSEHDDCECKFCGFDQLKKTARKLDAMWGGSDYSWFYMTDVPHVTFDILEGDEKYCRGIVINGADLRGDK